MFSTRVSSLDARWESGTGTGCRVNPTGEDVKG